LGSGYSLVRSWGHPLVRRIFLRFEHHQQVFAAVERVKSVPGCTSGVGNSLISKRLLPVTTAAFMTAPSVNAYVMLAKHIWNLLHL